MALEFPSWLEWMSWLVGSEWPHGNEDRMWQMARDLESVAGQSDALHDELTHLMDSIKGAYPDGVGGEQALEWLQPLRDGDASGHGSVKEFGDNYRQLSKAADDMGDQLQSAKLNFYIAGAWLVGEMAWAAMTGPFAPETEIEVITLARTTFRELGELLTKRIESLIGNRITNEVLKEIVVKSIYEIGKGAVVSTVQSVGQELAVQTVQNMDGHGHGYDWGAIGKNAAVAALSGAAGGAVGFGAHSVLPTEMGGWRGSFNGALTGFAAGVGGAGAGWLGNGLVNGNWEFDPRSIVGAGLAGAGPAGLHGYEGRSNHAGIPVDSQIPDGTRVPGRGTTPSFDHLGTDGRPGGDAEPRPAATQPGTGTSGGSDTSAPNGGEGGPSMHPSGAAGAPTTEHPQNTDTGHDSAPADNSGAAGIDTRRERPEADPQNVSDTSDFGAQRTPDTHTATGDTSTAGDSHAPADHTGEPTRATDPGSHTPESRLDAAPEPTRDPNNQATGPIQGTDPNSPAQNGPGAEAAKSTGSSSSAGSGSGTTHLGGDGRPAADPARSTVLPRDVRTGPPNDGTAPKPTVPGPESRATAPDKSFRGDSPPVQAARTGVDPASRGIDRTIRDRLSETGHAPGEGDAPGNGRPPGEGDARTGSHTPSGDDRASGDGRTTGDSRSADDGRPPGEGRGSGDGHTPAETSTRDEEGVQGAGHPTGEGRGSGAEREPSDPGGRSRADEPHAGLPGEGGPVLVPFPTPHDAEVGPHVSDNRRPGIAAAAPVGEFHGDARPEGELSQEFLDGEIDDGLRLMTPEGISWNRDERYFLLEDGRKIRIEIADTQLQPDTGRRNVAEIHPSADGYDIRLSRHARDEDVVRALAHELAEIRLAQDDPIPLDLRPDVREDRPGELTPHLAGRFAELRVLAAHFDRAVMDPDPARELPGVRRDLHDLTERLGLRDPDHAPIAEELLRQYDPELARRIALAEHGILEHRPTFDPSLTEDQFDHAAREHLTQLRDLLTGPHADDVLRAEEMGMQGRLREELARRILDPIFDQSVEAARKAWPELFETLDPISAAVNDPAGHGQPRADALHRAIDNLHDAMPDALRDAIGPGGFEHMHKAADALAFGPDHITGSIDMTTGRLTIDGEHTTLGEFLRGIDRANRGATEHGLNVEYTVVLHDAVDGHSAVEVLPRPRPQHRLPLEQNTFGEHDERIPLVERPSVQAAVEGGHTIDVGVGRGAFAVELTPAADRSGGGLVIKTELASEMPGPAQRRRDRGILDPGPLTEPGTVMVFGDLLGNGHLLGDGPGGEAGRVYINNVSAHPNEAAYRAMADRLETTLKPGGRIEIQWDMKPEEPGGRPGNRGHITGTDLWEAIKQRYEGRTNPFRVDEHTEFPPPGNNNYDYTINAGGSNNLDRTRMAGIDRPMPEHRMVIVYEPDAHHPPMPSPDPGHPITAAERDLRRNALPEKYYLYAGGQEARLRSGESGPPLRWDATADHGHGAWVEREGTLEPTPETPDHLRDDQKFMGYVYAGDRPSFSTATKYSVYAATEMNADGTYKCAVSGRPIPVVLGSDGHPRFHEMVGGRRTETDPPDWYKRGENPPNPPHDKFTIPEPNSAHMGHLPEYEYWRQRSFALYHKGTVEQFERVYDDPGHYRLELKEENEGHDHESTDPGYGNYPKLYKRLFPGETIPPIPAAPPDDSGIIKGGRKPGDPRR
ncbi:GH-E family nuclease [Nocardia sp. NPDC059240]|uniref:WXG100-like domain-containing protein n=1 Tax=Nocardia sp. NPDC059240 TaxID=3346786 RepID=UPI0036BFCFB3